MEFNSYTIAWCRGEIFEGKLFFLFGFVVVAVALLYWRFSSTPFSKAMFIPMLVVGLLCMGAGSSLVYSNQKRIVEYEKAYTQAPLEFIKSEKQRTEAFIKWYPYTMYGMSALIMLGISIFLFRPSPTGRAIGLALMLLAYSILFLDHFSEERADVYHQKIISQLE
jgi:glucan phosphoethanolaminetransferase (alkaline phosphatase superfamily)